MYPRQLKESEPVNPTLDVSQRSPTKYLNQTNTGVSRRIYHLLFIGASDITGVVSLDEVQSQAFQRVQRTFESGE